VKVGVTGSTGFLGGYICRRLAADGHDIRAMARETSDASFVKSLGAEVFIGDMSDPGCLAPFAEGCGGIVHAAVGFTAARGEEQTGNFEVNLLGSLRLLDRCRRTGAQFIFISSGAVHERILSDRPLDEAHPIWPFSTYGAYKAAVEAFLPAYHARFSLNCSAYRPTSIYGLHLTKPEKSQWYDMVRSVVEGRGIDTTRGGKVVHVEDVAEVVARAVGREDVAGEVYELTDCHIYDRKIAEFAREAAGSDAVITGETGPGPKHMIVCDKARATFNIGLNRGHDGVREYVRRLVGAIRKTS
jgi:nucleoside-diphosphate-sugar epimerase